MHLTLGRLPRPFASKIVRSILATASYPETDGLHVPGLRPLLESWIQAGCRFDHWTADNPERAKLLAREAGLWRLHFHIGKKAKPVAVIYPESEAEAAPGFEWFTQFLLCAAPHFHIGRCEKADCQNFYWNSSSRIQRRFCTREHSQLQTATEGQARKVSRLRQEKNAKIRKALAHFINEKPAVENWKHWIASRSGVSVKYLTRTLNRGSQGEPDGLKLSRSQRDYLKKIGGQHAKAKTP